MFVNRLPLLGLEQVAALGRMDSGQMENLGGVEIADSGNRALIERHWQESWKVWFPEGKSDPSLCLITFEAGAGEYWDNTGARGLKLALRAAKAYVSGERLEGRDSELNAKVHMS